VRAGRGRSKILIIDDEQVVLDACFDMLDADTYDVATAADGQAGLRLVDESGPDVVFVDLKMPGLSGFEVLSAIHESHPTITTVVITGYATVDSAVEAMRLGAYDFIPKPFTPGQFRLVTQRAVEKRELVLETIALRREREMLRENFAAIVSHELKSPLGAVQQNLYVLAGQLDPVATEEQRHMLGRMKTRLSDLLDMVDTWLRSVSVDMSGIRDRFLPVPISQLIETAVENVQPHAIRKNVEVTASVDDAVVCGDPGTLTEALTNIIGNAVKYSFEGGTVAVAGGPSSGRARIEVRDTGVGIPDEAKAYIFDDFFRADTGLPESGAGLGLAISRRIVQEHDGSIAVDGRPGEGTTFTVLLPLSADLDSESRRTTGHSRAPSKESSND
jgi:signal transduction histidine kinase